MIIPVPRRKGQAPIHVVRKFGDGFKVEQGGNRIYLSPDEARALADHFIDALESEFT